MSISMSMSRPGRPCRSSVGAGAPPPARNGAPAGRISVRERDFAIHELRALFVLVLAGVAGPLLSLSERVLVPPAACGRLASTVQLGVPAAVLSLGLQQGLLSAGDGAAIMVAALASIAVGGLGVALLHRRAAATSTV